MPPLNLVGDFGGGGMLLALGDGVRRSLEAGSARARARSSTPPWSTARRSSRRCSTPSGPWASGRTSAGTNLLDTGAHFYDVYETADGKYVSIGSIEPQFYAELLEHTGLADEDLPWQHDKVHWPALKERMAEIFRRKTRDEWCEIMEGTDVCFAPVLSMAEAPDHPHNV